MKNQCGFVDGEFIFGTSIVLVIIAMIGLIVWACIEDAKQEKAWLAYRVQHHFKITAYMDGSVSTSTVPVVGSNGAVGVGTVTTTTPAKEAWTCDDGLTYWKNQ